MHGTTPNRLLLSWDIEEFEGELSLRGRVSRRTGIELPRNVESSLARNVVKAHQRCAAQCERIAIENAVDTCMSPIRCQPRHQSRTALLRRKALSFLPYRPALRWPKSDVDLSVIG